MNTAPLTILVVATEPDRSVLAAPVGRLGWQVQAVANLDQAKAALQERTFDALLIAESELPPAPSPVFVSLREHTPAPIIVAGWGGTDALSEVLLDGADAYLVRPIPEPLLRARVRSLAALPRPRWRRRPESNLFTFPEHRPPDPSA